VRARLVEESRAGAVDRRAYDAERVDAESETGVDDAEFCCALGVGLLVL